MAINLPSLRLSRSGAIATALLLVGSISGAFIAQPEPASARSVETRIVRCESQRNRLENCYVRTVGRVRLVRQLSRASCNRNWGYSRNRIWVRNGCRADFSVRIRQNQGKDRYERGDRRYDDDRYGRSTDVYDDGWDALYNRGDRRR